MNSQSNRHRKLEQGTLMVIIMWAIVMLSGIGLIRYTTILGEQRAVYCSTILHRYQAGTLVPITEDASVEIGACLLQFNQPLTGETK